MKFYVTGEEKKLIEEKMKLLPTQRYGAYLHKMAIDGYVIYTDTANIKTFNAELQGICRNINQIAKRLNSGAPIYEADMVEIKERLVQIWQLQRHIETRKVLLYESLLFIIAARIGKTDKMAYTPENYKTVPLKVSAFSVSSAQGGGYCRPYDWFFAYNKLHRLSSF